MPVESTPAASVNTTHACPACGRPLRSDDNRKRNRFLWGIALAWLPFLPLLVGLANTFRGVSEQKATGIGAVAGGIAEMSVLYVITLAPILTISAMVLLLRSLSKAHPLRNMFAVISVCWGALMISVLALFFWLVYAKFPQF